MSPFLSLAHSSFLAGERYAEPLFCSCDSTVGLGPNVHKKNVVSTIDITLTGSNSGGPVYGSNPYTNDSALSVAAVQAGLVEPGETAVITAFNPDDYANKAPYYIGADLNGITSLTTTKCGFYIRRKSVGVLNGIASATDLVQYFGPKAGRAFRFTTQPGINKVTSVQITYAENGTSGFNYIITKDYSASISYPLGVTFLGGVDDGYYTVPVGWNVNFLGTSYSKVYIGTNQYVTFGAGSTEYAGLNYATPPYPKIMMGSGDHSVQRIWYGYIGSAPNRQLFIRSEGVKDLNYLDPTNVLPMNSPNYPGGPWQPNSGPMVYEMILYENMPNVIDFTVLANVTWL
jgi:hypothetical protein